MERLTGRLEEAERELAHAQAGLRAIAENEATTYLIDGVALSPLSLRLVYPSELDLMARIAGLQLVHRWGGWRREPFTVDSRRHVSVYGWPGD